VLDHDSCMHTQCEQSLMPGNSAASGGVRECNGILVVGPVVCTSCGMDIMSEEHSERVLAFFADLRDNVAVPQDDRYAAPCLIAACDLKFTTWIKSSEL
jgi:hypothetical protein